MSALRKKCVRTHRDPAFVLQDTPHPSKVEFLNPRLRLIDEVHVDGCIFDESEPLRCDYLVNINERNQSILLELKGSDVLHAIDQLRATTESLAGDLNSKLKWIVCYSGNPAFPTSAQAEELKVRRESRNKIVLYIRPSVHVHEIDRP
ncbi:MAG TPA: hypothetical protein VGK19_05625 [Capsulimonadaceae bacterium]